VAATTSPASPPVLERLLMFDAVEAAYDITGIEGQVPPWVLGSYYVIGPARFERGGRRLRHWLDGDGFVCALHFTGRGVGFAGRFVRTRKLLDEEAAGTFLYRAFGTAFPGDRLRRNVMIESPINVNVCHFGKRLLALGEQSLPVELDPETLETKGEFDFGRELNEVTPFSAHAKLDPHSRHALNFGISYAAARPVLNLYQLGQRAGLIRRSRVPLDLPYANHDFAFTRRHAVFFLSPLTLDFNRFLAGASIMESLAWQPERGSRMLLLPRAKGEKPFRLETGRGYCLHLINAFERGNELVCDILEYGDYQPMPNLFCVAPTGGPVRYVVDLEGRTLKRREPLSYSSCCDFPSVDAQRLGSSYQDFWLLGISSTGSPGPKFFDHLAHGSWAEGGVSDVYRAPAGTFLGGEPAFVGNPRDPGEGFVIVQQLIPNAGESAFLMFDAFDVRRGPLIRLPLKHQVHPLFHAAYYPAAYDQGF
jgi:all-trans-8'-apo-beta-carotenal 15,15'-oxygenase